MLNRIGLQKINGSWTYKRKEIEGVGPGGTVEQEGVEVVDPGVAALVPYVPLIQRGELLSHFEPMVRGRLDHIFEEQRMCHEYYADHF